MAYVKTIWLSGEIISAARLNHMEDGIYQNSLTPVITVDSELDPDSANPVENAAITDRILDIEDDMSGWSGEISTLSGRVSDLALDVEAVQDNMEDMEGDIESLDGSVTSINNSITTINQNLTGLNNSIGTINQNVAALSGRVDDTEIDILALQSDMEDAESDISTLSGNVSTLSGTVSTLSGTVSSLDTDLTTLSGTVSTLSGTVSSLSGDVSTLQSTVADKLDPDDIYPMFAKTEVSESITVNANVYNSKVGDEFTKSGYYPLAIMGYDFANTACYPVKMSIADPAVGSGKIFFGVKNTSGSQVTFNAKFYILWIKTN